MVSASHTESDQKLVLVLSNRNSKQHHHSDTVGAITASVTALTSRYAFQVLTAPSRTALIADAERLLEREGDRIAAVIVCGGDGMVNIGANLAIKADLPLGIVPLGSGNDFARGMRIRRGTRAINGIARALAATPEPVTTAADALLVRVENHQFYAANSVNFGFDSQINEIANARFAWLGGARYLASLVRLIPRFKPTRMRVSYEGPARKASLDGSFTLVSLLNTAAVGGGIRLAPGAAAGDGELDAVIIRGISRALLSAVFPLATVGLHPWLSPVKLVRIRELTATGPAELPVYVDGDLVGFGGYTAEVAPGVLRLLI